VTGTPASTTPRLLVVAKTTSYQTYVNELKDPRTTDLLARKDPAVERIVGSHDAHEETLREVLQAIAELGAKAHTVTTSTLVAHEADSFDLVVTVGGDGTLLTTSHEVGVNTPILGVNSAPDHSVGFFCGARKGAVRPALEAALAGTMRRTVVSRMQVELNGVCLSRRVLNDALFCHEIPAATSRYILTVRPGDGPPLEEEQKSSGLWIGPAAGSTAAQRSAGGHVLPLTSHRIQYVVREPYTPMGKPLALSRGTIDEGGTIVLRSKMRQAKLFLDGPHVVHAAGLGDLVTLQRSPETLTVLGLARPAGETRRPTPRPRRIG
jgi:NAD+ kinase